MTKFKTGEYTMRNGKPAKVWRVRDDGKLLGEAVIGGIWDVAIWEADGRFGSDVHDTLDLVPPLREFWVAGCQIFDTYQKAKSFSEVVLVDGEIIPVVEKRND